MRVSPSMVGGSSRSMRLTVGADLRCATSACLVTASRKVRPSEMTPLVTREPLTNTLLLLCRSVKVHLPLVSETGRCFRLT